MNNDGADQEQPSAGGPSNVAGLRSINDLVDALAARRLAQITAVLGLDAAHFERAHRTAKASLDGAQARILADQSGQVLKALADVGDPLARARVVELMSWLAEDKAD